MLLKTLRAAALAAALSLSGATLAAPASAQEPVQDAAAAEPVVVDSVAVQGNVRTADAVIRTEIGIQAGQTVTYRDLQQAQRRLWATGQFSDVRVFAAPATADPAGPVVLTFTVEERPFVAQIDFRGLEHVKGSKVQDTVGLRTGPLQMAKVTAAEAMVRDLLAKEGFRVRSIEHRLEEIEGRPGQHRLIFDVREGTRVAISEIDFVGNEVFSDDELRGALGTKQEGFFWFRSGTLDEAQLRTDLREKLPEHYWTRGYIDFAVVGDSMVVDPQTGKARLVIELAEGPQYRLADFDIRGNKRFASDELRRYFDRQQGGLLGNLGLGGRGEAAKHPVFDQVAFHEATQQVNQLYRNQGYLYAQVEPVVVRSETEAGEPAVDVAWEVREGEPAYVNRVTIAGNTFTHEQVIRDRILLLPGDVYNEELLIQSYRSIMALGFFESPLPMPRIEPNDQGDVDITFEVKERQTGSVNFGTALGGYGGVAGFLGYDQPNLFGQAKAGSLRWEFGRYSNNFQASYSDPAILGSRISGSASLFSTKNGFNRAFRLAEGDFRRTGASLRFGLPLPNDRWSRLFVGYSLSRTEYDFEQGFSSLLRPGVQSTVNLGLTRSTTDHPLFPTVGSRQEIDVDLTGGPLGGDGDFQKYSLASQWYVPVGQIGGSQPGSRPIRFTLGLSAEAGALFGDASRFPFDRFYMGGVQFGRSLRGYDETTITPFGYFQRNDGSIALEDRFGDAYLKLSAEYAVRFNDNLSLSLFYDAGNVWGEPSQVNPTRLLRGAGVGVMLVTPFGPLGLDYAYGFDKHVPGWQLHFKMGPGL